VLGFSGIVLLVWPELTHGAGTASRAGFLTGIVSLQIACFGWSVGSSYSKRHARGDYYRVIVRYPDGHEETYTQDEIGDLHVGDRVHREAGRLYRD